MRPQGSDRAGLGGPSLRPEARQPYLQKLGLGGAWGGRSGGPAGSAGALALSLWHPCWVPSGSQPGQEAPQGGSWIRSLGFLPRASSFIPGGARARGAGCRTVLVLQGQHSFVGGGGWEGLRLRLWPSPPSPMPVVARARRAGRAGLRLRGDELGQTGLCQALSFTLSSVTPTHGL